MFNAQVKTIQRDSKSLVAQYCKKVTENKLPTQHLTFCMTIIFREHKNTELLHVIHILALNESSCRAVFETLISTIIAY